MKKPPLKPTVIRAYFSRQYLNQLVKRLYVISPDVRPLTNRIAARIRPWLAYRFSFFAFDQGALTKSLPVFDLNCLHTELAIKLKTKNLPQIYLKDKLPETDVSLDIKKVLVDQHLLLRQLLEEQREVLSREAQDIMREEKKKIRSRNNRRTH